MVVRSWEGRVRSGAGDEYLAHLTEAVIPEIRVLPGNLGVQVLRSAGDAADRFMVLSYWSDAERIKAFAGPDAQHAVVPPEARALLSEFDERARHFDVVLDLMAPP